MALPGTPGQRISDLCNGNHITQKQLAKKIGVSASQLSPHCQWGNKDGQQRYSHRRGKGI